MAKAKTKANPPTEMETEDSAPPDKSASGEPKEIKEGILLDAQEKIRLHLRPIRREVIHIRIQGDALITHAWGPKALRKMLEAMQMTKAEKKLANANREKRDPDSDFQEARYIRNGKDCFPTNGVKKSLVEAAYQLGINKNAIRRGLRIVGDFVEIKTKKPPVRREDHVRIGKFGESTDLRYRPQYNDWHMDLQVVYRTDMFTQEQIAMLFQHAGWGGIGEWRPERDGQFGTFDVASE